MHSNLYPISHTIMWRKHNEIIFRVTAAKTQCNGVSHGGHSRDMISVGSVLTLERPLVWALLGLWHCLKRVGNSFSPSSDLIFLDFWPRLCLCLCGEGIKNLENHHHRRFQFSRSPLSCSTNQFSPFFLRWHVGTYKGLSPASVPFNGAQGPPRGQCPPSARLLLPSNSELSFQQAASPLDTSWVAVGGREGFVERAYLMYEPEVKTQHSSVSRGDMGGTF